MARLNFKSFRYKDRRGFEWIVFLEPGSGGDIWAAAPKGSPYPAADGGNNITFIDGVQSDNAIRAAIDQFVADFQDPRAKSSGSLLWFLVVGWMLYRSGKRAGSR